MVKCLLISDTHYGHSGKTHRHHLKFFEKIREEIENGVEIIIHAGDWTSNRQDQFRRTLVMFRKELGDIPIVCVRGNHDFWDQKKGGRKQQSKWMYGQLMQMHESWFKESNIHHLESGAFEYKDIVIAGFDGWYGNAKAPTNDELCMVSNVEGCPTMVYLSSKAYKDLDKVLQLDFSKYRKSICVTHFPPFAGDWKGKDFSANFKFFDPITDKFDILCVGHSHMYVNRIENNTEVYNCGGHYDDPKYLIFEV